MPSTATVRSSSDTLRHEIAIRDHTVVVDEPEDLGGTDTAATPFELLAAAVAGCVAVTVRMYARRKQWGLSEVGVEVTIDRDAEPPRCTITVQLPEACDPERLERLHRIAAACPVSKTLTTGLRVEHAVVTSAGA